MRTESLAKATWAERYEELRRTALATSRTGEARGLALLVRHGLAGWMAAWQTLVGAKSGPVPSGSVPAVPPDLRSALAGTLAGIALRNWRGGNP